MGTYTSVREVVVRFHVDHIEAVLVVLNPYRRRQLSEAQKKRQAERLAAFRFGKFAAVQDTKAPPESKIASPRPTGTGASHAV